MTFQNEKRVNCVTLCVMAMMFMALVMPFQSFYVVAEYPSENRFVDWGIFIFKMMVASFLPLLPFVSKRMW